MKIFEKNNKVNFIDENNLLLGYNLEQDCCEDAGWFVADCLVSKTKFEGDSLSALADDWSGWLFDPDFFKEVEDEDCDNYVVAFRISKDGEEKFIHLYNVHNGYYSHNFHFSENAITIKDSYI